MNDNIRQWVNADRTVLVTAYPGDTNLYVGLRETRGDIWGPPTTCRPDEVPTDPIKRLGNFIGFATVAWNCPICNEVIHSNTPHEHKELP